MLNLSTILVTVARLNSIIYDRPYPFGKLEPIHQLEMKTLWLQGRTIEVWRASVDGWEEDYFPQWLDAACYRIRRNDTENKIAQLEDEILALHKEIDNKESELLKLLKD